jgi:HK97 family phage major capsid protein
MNKIQELRAKAREKATAIKALLDLDAPDMEQVGKLQAEADALLAQADALEKAEGVIKTVSAPVLPAELPTDAEPEPKPEETAATKTFNAVYQLRYGDEADAVKAILTDLHGPDYGRKRISQWGAFNRYLRGGDVALKSGEQALLREVILTPEYASQAIKRGLDIAAVKTVMVEAADDLGGYTVPVDWQARILERLMGLVVMRGRAFTMQTSRDKVQIPTMTGGDSQYSSAIRVTWVDEAPTAGTAATNMTFGQEEIPVYTCMAEAFVSRNLVEDSAFDLAGYLARKFAEAAAVDEDNQFLTGDGNGRPQGLLPSSGNALSLSEAESGVADSVSWDGLIELIYEPDSQYRSRCVFIGEKATYKAIAKLKDGQGQYLWRDRFGNNVSEGGELTRLMGYPVFEQEAMPTITNDAYVLLFGDPEGYTIVDRVGMTVERFLDSSTARINQICYVMRRRLGGQCTETYRWAVQKCHT